MIAFMLITTRSRKIVQHLQVDRARLSCSELPAYQSPFLSGVMPDLGAPNLEWDCK